MEVFIELSLIIAITVFIAGITRLLKQPLIIGYILAGIIVSPYFLNIVQSTETIKIFSQIGIALLLFIVGLSLSPKVIREVGKVSLITGIALTSGIPGLVQLFSCNIFGLSIVP